MANTPGAGRGTDRPATARVARDRQGPGGSDHRNLQDGLVPDPCGSSGPVSRHAPRAASIAGCRSQNGCAALRAARDCSLDDLEQAAKAGELRELKGMGARKEQLLLNALEERRAACGAAISSPIRRVADAFSLSRRRVPGVDFLRGRQRCGARPRPAAISTCSPSAQRPSDGHLRAVSAWSSGCSAAATPRPAC